MKIAKVSSFFWPVKGGMENHLYYEGKEFLKLKHDYVIYTSDSVRIGKIKKKFSVIDGLQVKRFPTLFRLSYFTPVFPALFWSILTEDYDVLHVHSYRQFHNLAVLFAKLRGKPVALSTHWPEYPKEVRGNFLYYATKLYDFILGKKILRAADKIIVQTESEKKWVINNFNIENNVIEIIPPGIEKNYLKKINSKKFRKKYKIKEKNIVLCIGRLHKSKGFDRIINIAKSFKNTKFVFVGPNGGEKANLENLSQELKVSEKVLFTDEVSEKEKLEALAACNVLVMPSDYEAFGI